jgi:hypothetical protein
VRSTETRLPSKESGISSSGEPTFPNPNVCPHIPLCSVISSAILVLLRELESACEAAFVAMARTPWNHLEHVSSQSSYMTDLVIAIKAAADAVRDHVEKKKYLRNFCDKAARYRDL